MTVELEVGMTGIRRDGVRKGLVESYVSETYPYKVWNLPYTPNGEFYAHTIETDSRDIGAAGYPWANLGANPGDTVRRVWDGYFNKLDDHEFITTIETPDAFHSDSLFVIVKRAVVFVFSELEIEWGDWLVGDCQADCGNNVELRIVKGIIVAHRLPKPPTVKFHEQYMYFDGTDYKIKLTKVGNETTVEIISQRDYN